MPSSSLVLFALYFIILALSKSVTSSYRCSSNFYIVPRNISCDKFNYVFTFSLSSLPQMYGGNSAEFNSGKTLSM